MTNDQPNRFTGYLIDPERRTIEAVQIEERRGAETPRDGWDHIRELLGYGDKSLSWGNINQHGDHIWCADDGLQNGPCFAFRIYGYRHPLAGRAIIIGSDTWGESTSPWVTKDWLNEHVRFLGEIVPRVSWVQEGDVTRARVEY